MPYIILIAGLYLLFIGWMFDTKGFGYFFAFKAVPATLGVILVAHAVKTLGWLTFL